MDVLIFIVATSSFKFLFLRYSRMQSGPDRLYALCETGLATHVVLHDICDLRVSDSSTIVETELNGKLDRFMKSTRGSRLVKKLMVGVLRLDVVSLHQTPRNS